LVLDEGPIGVDCPRVDFILKFVELASPPPEAITEVAISVSARARAVSRKAEKTARTIANFILHPLFCGNVHFFEENKIKSFVPSLPFYQKWAILSRKKLGGT
jgi:hypothetical protein